MKCTPEQLAERTEQAYDKLTNCVLCPRRCGVNRLAGQLGFCRTPAQAKVSSYNAHFGEESPLVGQHGSGTLFFSHCNLLCAFCQNCSIAHQGQGRLLSDAELAGMMLDLQRRGCHNINFVTPSHVIANLLGAIQIAQNQGLTLPICYNTGSYDTVESLKLLDGVVDIYLADLKFMDDTKAAQYIPNTADYSHTAQQAILEMARQVGNLTLDEHGCAVRGLMLRHLVMPNRMAGTQDFVKWVAEQLSKETYVNIMAQYHLEHDIQGCESINRPITAEEFLEAMDWAHQAGLKTLDSESLLQAQTYRRRLEASG